MIAGSPALRWLLATKLRGSLRKQVRRLKQPSGIVFGILGAFLFAFWIISLVVSSSFRGAMFAEGADPRMVRVFCLTMTLLTVTGALSHRGVVMPREEIERLFSGPVSRPDIVRYRMLANSGRYLMSGAVFGLLSIRSLPHPVYGPASVFVAMMTLPLAGQAAALLLGSAEHRFADKWRRGGRARALQTVTVLLVIAMVLFMTFGKEMLPHASIEGLSGLKDRVLEWPVVRALLIPFIPWSNAMTATTFEDFVPSLGILFVFWVMLFEFAARLPIDFRELSLDTSANVAKRIREMRRSGMGASSGKAAIGRLSRRIPWIFGHSSFGSVAWMKLSSVLRKARGTLIVSSLIIVAISIFFIALSRGVDDVRFVPPFLGFVLTLYLSGALRFDFRADIDRLESFKSWPLPPSRLFVANLLPQVLFVSLAVALATTAYTLICSGDVMVLSMVLLGAPFVVFSWTAIDNAIFLFLPQRTIAGQEGMLQHLGRSMILLMAKFTVLGFVSGIGGILGFGVWWLADSAGASERATLWSISGALLVLLLIVGVLLAWIGGKALRRLDVSRIPK